MDTQFNRRLMVSLGIVFGSIAVASGLLYYLAGDLSSNVHTIVADRTLIDQQTGAISTLAQLKQDAAAAAPYQLAMDQLLTSQDGLIAFSSWLQKIGNANQVAVTATFNPNTPPQNPPPGDLPMAATMAFSLQAQGSVTAIAAFLKDLQSHPGFFVQLASFDMVNSGSNALLSAQGVIFFKQG